MSFRTDVVDWLGGFPYEYASADEVVRFMSKKRFKLLKLNLTEREGCNEYLFQRRKK